MDNAQREATLRQIDVLVVQALAETSRLAAERDRISRESWWYPVVRVGGLFAAAYVLLRLVGT